MTLLTLQAAIGKTALFADPRGALRFRVTIKDAKQSYGNTRYLVEPVSGDGSRWVDARNVEIEEG